VTITLTGPRADSSNDMGNDPADNVDLGSKGIAIATGGFIEIWGAYNKAPYSLLSQTANINATSIYVNGTTSWAVGDKLVVVETDYPAVQGTYTGDVKKKKAIK
jgi:hypothetical protein